ncbi:MAG: hypothetical protein IPJ98_29880 [Bryobacterales bacterium]|nr:hypothetical protein [Bryobacterales bacterium]
MFRSVLTATLLAALASFSLPAQSVKLQATIPFDFHAGDALMPAGEYLVTHTSGFLLLRGQYNHPKSAGVIVAGATKAARTNACWLTFNRYGDDYFLASVSQEGSGLVLHKTKREHVKSRILTESAAARAPMTTTIAARGAR